MHRPSSTLKPNEESTLRRSFIAHRLAPLPRCATITRPSAIPARPPAIREAMYSYDNRESHSAGRRVRGSRRERHQLGDRGLPAMEAGVEARHLGHARQPLGDRLDRSEVVRLMSGASGTSAFSSASTCGVMTTGFAWRAPPWTTRWPTPSTWASP
jgi:hypothetical protein